MPAVVRPVADERDALFTFLAHQRHVVKVAAHGLTDEQATHPASVSDVTIGGLLKHLASVERSWAATVARRTPSDSNGRQFEVAASETIAGIVADYEEACAATDEVLAEVSDFDQIVPVPEGARWAPPDVAGWNVRWVLLHLIHETARHAGHADIIRESIDGARALSLMAAVEGWPARRTIRSWTPSAEKSGGGEPAPVAPTSERA